jgi:hypothetical protein
MPQELTPAYSKNKVTVKSVDNTVTKEQHVAGHDIKFNLTSTLAEA